MPDFREGGFVVWDRGKEAVRLDVDATGGAAACRTDAGRADVLVEDLAPSSPRQTLVAWGGCRALNPRLVACSITAYGKRGPWKDEPPIEDLVLARTGLLGGHAGLPAGARAYGASAAERRRGAARRATALPQLCSRARTPGAAARSRPR